MKLMSFSIINFYKIECHFCKEVNVNEKQSFDIKTVAKNQMITFKKVPISDFSNGTISSYQATIFYKWYRVSRL